MQRAPEENGLDHVSEFHNRYLSNIARQQQLRALARLVVTMARNDDADIRRQQRRKARELRGRERVAEHCRIVNATTKEIDAANRLLAASEDRFARAS